MLRWFEKQLAYGKMVNCFAVLTLNIRRRWGRTLLVENEAGCQKLKGQSEASAEAYHEVGKLVACHKLVEWG